MIRTSYIGILLSLLSITSIAATTYSYLHREAPTSYWSWPDQTIQHATARVLFTASESEYLTSVTTHTFSLMQDESLYSDVCYLDLTIYASIAGQAGAILYQREDIVSEFNTAPDGKLTITIPPTLVSADFIVEICYNNSLYPYMMPIEFSSPEDEAPIDPEPIGKQWISMDGGDFLPAGKGGAYPFNICITATTSPIQPKVGFELDHYIYPQNENITLTNRSTEGFVSYEWLFGSEATPTTSTQTNPTFQYTSRSSGRRDIRLIGKAADGSSDTIIQSIQVVRDLPLDYILNPPFSNSIPRSTPITLTAIGAWSYKWEIVSPDSLIVGHQAFITTPHAIGSYSYKLIGAIGSKSRTLTIPITTYAIAHDDRSDAKQIEAVGKWYEHLSNTHATTEIGEPSATIGQAESDCRKQDKWCPGNEITNTIWFTFVAPEGRGVRIETKGFDNRIALYKADRWEYLNTETPELYRLIAANDDGDHTNAAIIETALTTAGERYWIQLDGSNRLVWDTISIQVLPIDKIEYDYVADYGTLQLNKKEGPFNSTFCTIEPHEPTPYQWKQQLLQSMWFTFSTPSSELLSIHSAGIPIRMALYMADSPKDILLGNCMLISDNQDGAGIIKQELHRDKQYWIQTDRADQAGIYYLTLNSHPIENTITAYWDKSEESVNLISNNEVEQVRIFNLQGVLLHIEEGNHRTDLQIDGSDLPKGKGSFLILMVKNKGGNKQYTKVLIL